MNNRQEAYEQYLTARKLAQKDHRSCVLHGRYPYPQVLDDILVDPSMIAGQVDLGVIEVPIEKVVGTKTEGRRLAFASNFMPLLEPDTEFAAKWMELCSAHLGDEGIRDPIRCCEYLGRFYVLEGNKRVSVLKSYGASTIPGYVTRIIPTYSDDPEIQLYYEFLEAYQHTRLYRVHFSQSGSFQKLQAALGYEPDHVWTNEERLRFLSSYTYFREAFHKLGGEQLPISGADALLVWLRVYPFSDLKEKSASELQKSLAAIWPDVKILGEDKPIAVSTESPETDPGIIRSIVNAMFPGKLQIAFLNESSPEESPWIRAHDLGRQYLEAVLGDRIEVRVYDHLIPNENAEEIMEKAVQEGAQVLFATTPPLIGVCRKIAAMHPELKILNCSVAMPYTGVRTYYSRIYEGKFITGAIAGALCRDNVIGYVASYPIFGVPAGINAFALGAKLTNPWAKIRLRWSCSEEDPLGAFAREGITYVSNRDMPDPSEVQGSWGLCRCTPEGQFRTVASPYWHWGKFYERMVRTILDGGWDALSSKDGEKAVNYWWGMRSGVVGLDMSPDLPDGVQLLADMLRRGVVEGSIYPFHRIIRSQDGILRNDGNHWLSADEILHMDWLCDSVEGQIPSFDQLLPMSQAIVRLQGVYRDQLPPEKEGTLL